MPGRALLDGDAAVEKSSTVLGVGCLIRRNRLSFKSFKDTPALGNARFDIDTRNEDLPVNAE